MGLDITAYRGAVKLDVPHNANGEPLDASGATLDWRSYCQPYVNPDFPERASDIENLATYGFKERFDFRAGTYHGYGIFRQQLAMLAGYDGIEAAWDADQGPFWELLNFSDCEGTIGPTVSRKLAQDFAAFQAQADTLPASSYVRETYAHWRRAFEMAADNGMVRFH